MFERFWTKTSFTTYFPSRKMFRDSGSAARFYGFRGQDFCFHYIACLKQIFLGTMQFGEAQNSLPRTSQRAGRNLPVLSFPAVSHRCVSNPASTVITFSGFCAESRDSVLCNFTSWLADVQREYRVICLWCKDFAEKKREQTLCVQGQ